MKNEDAFHSQEPLCYEQLDERLKKLQAEGTWVFRGQAAKWDLETTLERYCNLSRYKLTDARGIEAEMIRNFQRLYVGEDREEVISDTLYCISLMRHYGAPSRLLDFTYSKDVATYFGLEYAFETVPLGTDGKPDYDANRSLAIWCVNAGVLDSQIEKKYPKLYKNSLKPRKDDSKRNDKTFVGLYMANAGKFVRSDNPVKLHQRLDIQQGVFLCPGTVAKSFMQNLKNLYDGKNNEWIFKFTCELSPVELRDALEDFRHKTITRQSLLPGPDGFAQSMRYKLVLFYDLYESRRNSGANYPFSKRLRKPK